MTKITRIEVIDENGRSYVNHGDDNDVSWQFQDDGRTLKVFVNKPKQREDLWCRIGGKTGPYDLGPEEIANILELIAEEVEHRGTIDYDRDPGETAEWLMHEAKIARQSMNL
jgi:hypothetical protein